MGWQALILCLQYFYYKAALSGAFVALAVKACSPRLFGQISLNKTAELIEVHGPLVNLCRERVDMSYIPNSGLYKVQPDKVQ